MYIFRDKLAEQGICIRVIGNLSLLSEDMRKLFAEAMILTKNNNKATLNIAFSYTCKTIIYNIYLYSLLYFLLNMNKNLKYFRVIVFLTIFYYLFSKR